MITEISLEDYLEFCKEEYELRKLYKISTFEQQIILNETAKNNRLMKKIAQTFKARDLNNYVFIGSPENKRKLDELLIDAN